MSTIKFTKFTSSTGPLAKVISKGADGTLVKKASAQFYAGTFETISVDADTPGAAARLSAALQTFTSHQALSASLSLGAASGAICTVGNQAQHPNAIPRTKNTFGYIPKTPGLLVIDFDLPKGASPITIAELWAIFLKLCPAAAHSIALGWVSGSSLIFDGDQQLSGVSGLRLYIVVADQSDIPRALKNRNKRAWLLGLGGHIHISSVGAKLTRGIFDSAMGDLGARLDFAPAGAVCRDGLEQRRDPPVVLADGTPLDTRTACPDLTVAEDAEVTALIEAAKLRAEPEAQAVIGAYLAEKQQAAAVQAVTDGKDPDEARERVKREHRALLGGVLAGDAVLIVVNEDGTETEVTVNTWLSDPKKWQHSHALSPHEPNHRGRSPDAIAYLLQASPILFDLNDHVTYRLQKQPVALQVTAGNKAVLAEQIANELVKYPDLMQCAGKLVRVVDGAFSSVSLPMLTFITGTRVALSRKNKDGKFVAVDVDQQTIQMLHALLTERARKVIARSSIPLIDASGRVIDKPGLDETTGIYLELLDDEEPISLTPTRKETVEAIRRAWHPHSLYEWETPHCRAAMLATVLTVPLRPTIDAAPGLFVDAGNQGAGKSSAIGTVMVMAQGDRSNMKSWTSDSEIELEKYLLSLAQSGASVVGFDNITRVFDSSTIATSVIEGRVSARKMGLTESLSPTFRAMWLASGNNGSISKDCAVRFMQARIACPDGQPHRKSFPFEPSDAARADRMGIVRAIITVHRAWHAAGAPQADGITTRFPDWGRTIRAITLWLASSGLAAEAGIGPLGDPADSILNRIADSDPAAVADTELFSALRNSFEPGDPFPAAELAQMVRAGKDSVSPERRQLWDAVMNYFPRQINPPSPQSLSALLWNRRDRVYAGLKLVLLPKPATREGERAGKLFAIVEV